MPIVVLVIVVAKEAKGRDLEGEAGPGELTVEEGAVLLLLLVVVLEMKKDELGCMGGG